MNPSLKTDNSIVSRGNTVNLQLLLCSA